MGGQPVIKNASQKGPTTTPTNPSTDPSANTVGFIIPDNSVSHPGSGREVDGISDGIISGNLHPGRTQTIAAGAPLFPGTIPKNQPTQFLPPSMHPGRSSVVPEPNNRNFPPVNTMTAVSSTTSTMTQSCVTIPGSGDSLSPVLTTSSHGAFPGGHPPPPSNSIPSAMSSSPMVTACSATSHSSNTSTYVSSPSAGSIPVLVPSISEVVAQSMIDAMKGVASKQKSPLCPDASHHSESSGSHLAANRQLAWAQIKSNTRAPKFDGMDPSKYKRWKVSMENEVRDLEISSVQWLELLALRSEGMVAEVVKRSEDMVADNPDDALAFVWRSLDRRFKSHPVAAEKLLIELQQFPLVSPENPNNLCHVTQNWLTCDVTAILPRRGERP